MARRDARPIPDFDLIDISDIPGRKPPNQTEGEGSGADEILRRLSRNPGKAARIHEPDNRSRDNLGPLINRIGRARGTPIRQKQHGEYLYVWLASED